MEQLCMKIISRVEGSEEYGYSWVVLLQQCAANGSVLSEYELMQAVGLNSTAELAQEYAYAWIHEHAAHRIAATFTN